jgi:hypothetical protein
VYKKLLKKEAKVKAQNKLDEIRRQREGDLIQGNSDFNPYRKPNVSTPKSATEFRLSSHMSTE